jgi:transcriptional regulator with XRE-family HTH domain
MHRAQQVELVGRKIRQLRKERRLTQNDLAARIGIQQSDLSRIERGEYRVSLDILFRMLAEFRVSVTEFFEEGAAQPRPAASSFGPREVLLVQQLNALPSTDQEEIRRLISRRSAPAERPANLDSMFRNPRSDR